MEEYLSTFELFLDTLEVQGVQVIETKGGILNVGMISEMTATFTAEQLLLGIFRFAVELGTGIDAGLDFDAFDKGIVNKIVFDLVGVNIGDGDGSKMTVAAKGDRDFGKKGGGKLDGGSFRGGSRRRQPTESLRFRLEEESPCCNCDEDRKPDDQVFLWHSLL